MQLLLRERRLHVCVCVCVSVCMHVWSTPLKKWDLHFKGQQSQMRFPRLGVDSIYGCMTNLLLRGPALRRTWFYVCWDTYHLTLTWMLFCIIDFIWDLVFLLCGGGFLAKSDGKCVRLISKQCLLSSSERWFSSVKLCNMYIDWKWNCSAKSQYIWLLCKPGVILFLKVATPTLNTIVQMPPFALLATRAMVPSSACISQDWPDSCVGLDHFRGRTGFSFKIKNWTVVGPAPSHFFC